MPTVTETFSVTGGLQTYTVPAGVSSVTMVAKGASGSSWNANGGGTGAVVTGTLAVTGGQVLNIQVGGGGGSSTGGVGGYAGYNGGGGGGFTAGQSGFFGGAGGGGASDVRSGGTGLGNRILIAGGGGGASSTGLGGAGGALSATAGAGSGVDAGGGGTQSAGGAAGGAGGSAGTAGASGQGGTGGGNSVRDGAGGGGGGYFGGGGAGATAAGLTPSGGGGGSSFETGLTSTSSTAGTQGGNPFTGTVNDGYVTISYTDTAPNAPTLVAPVNFGYADATNCLLDWTFSDPDSADFQTAASIRYRVLGALAWTTLTSAVSGTTSQYVLTDLVPGLNYEWQVLTVDSQGVAGPWSSSFVFQATYPAIPLAGFAAPIPGQPITDITTQGFDWIKALRNQQGYNIRRLGDINGVADPTTVYENTGPWGNSSSHAKVFADASVHKDGPEHWQIQFRTFNGQVVSSWYDFYIIMSYDAPPTPLCTATVLTSSGAIQVTAQLADFSVDYFSKSAVPTVADTGQALTTIDAPAINTGSSDSNGLLYAATTVFGQSTNLGSKCLSMACTFQFHDANTTHANSISMLAGDTTFANSYLWVTSTRSGWAISKNVAGTSTQLASASYATLLPGPAVPLTMYATISGTTITFVDPLGGVHTATDAAIGSQTGTFAKISVDNTGTTTPDLIQVAHWSADAGQNPATQATISRSIDGENFDPIPGASWDSQDFGALFTYIDYAAPFNTKVYYQVNAYTAAGALSQSVVS